MAYFDQTCDDCGLGIPTELTVTETGGATSCPFCSARVPDSAFETGPSLTGEVLGEEL